MHHKVSTSEQVSCWRVDLLVSEQQFLLVRCLSRQAGENSKKESFLASFSCTPSAKRGPKAFVENGAGCIYTYGRKFSVWWGCGVYRREFFGWPITECRRRHSS